METISPEEFKKRYGQVGFDQFSAPPQPAQQEGSVSRAAQKVTDFMGLDKAADVFGAHIARHGFGSHPVPSRELIEEPTPKQTVGAAAQTAATIGGAAIGGPATLAGKIALATGLGYAYDVGQDLATAKSDVEAAVPGFGAAIGLLGPLGGPAARGIGSGGRKVIEGITQSPVVKGALGAGIELGERVPRFVSRAAAKIRDTATRSERIANSPAPVGNALKAGIDERVVNTIEQADEPTRQGYEKIIRLAEDSVDTSGTLKATARPEIVAGDAAASQYKLIDSRRREVGKKIGEEVEKLSSDTQIPMKQSYETLDAALDELGVGVNYNEVGTTLDFSKTGFTKAQRAKIIELYQLATEGGDTLTPAQIHAKDRIFSQLQREARMENIGDIMVDTGEGTVSLFRVFRDVYSDTLEQVAPEIKPLNKQYRNLVTFLDDIESSIFKSGNFETNSRLDPAEFAQTNLRRLFSEATSAADYRAIAEEMDAAARALGYEGPIPSDLARFAYEIRKIYPETTPRTGFEGSIKTSVGDVVKAALNAGVPDVVDQQKALRALINSMVQTQK